MRSYPAKRQIRYTIWFNWENFNLCSIIIIFKIFSFSVQNIIHIYLYIQILNLLSTLNYRSKCGYSSGNNLLCTCSSLHLSICHKHSSTSIPSEHSFSSTGYIVIPYCTHLLQILLWITKRDTVIPYKYMNYIWCWPNKLILHTPKLT